MESVASEPPPVAEQPADEAATEMTGPAEGEVVPAPEQQLPVDSGEPAASDEPADASR
jgi:hypothetical protein